VAVTEGVSVDVGKTFVGVTAGVMVASGEGTDVEADTLHDASKNESVAHKMILEKI
jgi:hypothetical protein